MIQSLLLTTIVFCGTDAVEAALNVRGLAAGTVGPTARNVIAPTATVSLDIRLVKGNDPGRMLDLLEAHVREQGYTIVREPPDRRHDNNQHAPDENLRIANLWYGMDLMAAILTPGGGGP